MEREQKRRDERLGEKRRDGKRIKKEKWKENTKGEKSRREVERREDKNGKKMIQQFPSEKDFHKLTQKKMEKKEKRIDLIRRKEERKGKKNDMINTDSVMQNKIGFSSFLLTSVYKKKYKVL